MNIIKKLDGGRLTMALEGRLDTTTAPALEAELKQSLSGVTELRFDLAALEYISSAGLRVLLGAHKAMKGVGSMVVCNVGELVAEVFDLTGFSDILSIE